MSGSLKAALCAAAFVCAPQAHAATNWVYDTEPNDTFATAQEASVPTGPGNYNTLFVEGRVEGTGAGIFDYYKFVLNPYPTGIYGYQALTSGAGFDVTTGILGPSPLVVLYDANQSIVRNQLGLTPGTYYLGIGRGEGSTASAYRAYVSVLAVPEPTTWALMLAGFGLTGYALRRRRSRVAFA